MNSKGQIGLFLFTLVILGRPGAMSSQCQELGTANPQAGNQHGRSAPNHISAGTLQYYSWFADVAFDLFKKGDYDSAARVARVMEISWDRDGDRFQSDLWSRVDQASDDFVYPIEHSSSTQVAKPAVLVADLNKVEAAYRKYLQTLRDVSASSKWVGR
jgi:hypothetical protein